MHPVVGLPFILPCKISHHIHITFYLLRNNS